MRQRLCLLPPRLRCILHRWNESRTRPFPDDYNRELRCRVEVEGRSILARLVQVLHVHTHTRKGPDKLKLEQGLNDSGVSTAHRCLNSVQVSISPFILTFHPSARSLSDAPTESSPKLTYDKLSAFPGEPIHTTDTTRRKRGHGRGLDAVARLRLCLIVLVAVAYYAERQLRYVFLPFFKAPISETGLSQR